jgi:hypothetical protein
MFHQNHITMYIYVQVIYDRSSSGRKLGKYCGVSLAWWHNYKWATKKILQVFACDFFGPLFHHIFPSRKFTPGKSSLSSNATILTYVRLAYPMFRNQLANAIAMPTLNVRQKTLLQNLTDLCDFFIPVVLHDDI